jgi:hypothetical protein
MPVDVREWPPQNDLVFAPLALEGLDLAAEVLTAEDDLSSLLTYDVW